MKKVVGRKMKKLSMILLIILFPSICSASLYFSPFGFTVNIPSNWEVINSEEWTEAREPAFRKILAHFDVLSENQRQKIIRMLKNGEVEYWYFEGGNVNIYKKRGTVLKRSDFDPFKKEMSKHYPGAILHDINLKKIGGCDAFYSEWSGFIYGVRNLTVNVQVKSNEYLAVTLGGKDDSSFQDLKREFWNVMSTFKPL
jgi:hypothetical protein